MDRIFYKSSIVDEPKKVPVYIFDTSFLPSPEIINYDEFILTLMKLLPNEPYTLIMFGGGLNKISWIWGLKFIKKFLIDDANLNNLNKILMVHESWFIKTLTSILNNYNLTKKNLSFLNKMIENFTMDNNMNLEKFGSFDNGLVINCKDLFELNQYFDITKLKISLNVYKHDYSLNNCDNLKDFKNLNFNINKFNPVKVNEIFKYHFYQIFDIIYIFGDKVELIFHKPGNKISSEIFVSCIKRDQLLWINDWDLYCIATSFKKLVVELPVLLPIKSIHLPVTDKSLIKNFREILKSLNKDLSLVLVKIFELFNKLISNPKTKLTSQILAKNFVSVLTHETFLKSNEPNLIIGINFIKKVIDTWDQLDITSKDHLKWINNENEIVHENENDNPFYETSDKENKENFPIETSNNYIDYDLVEESPKKALHKNDVILNSHDYSPKKTSPMKTSPVKSVPHLPSITNFQTVNSPVLQPIRSHPKLNTNVSPLKPSTKLSPTENSPTKLLFTKSSPKPSPTKISVQYPPQKYSFEHKRSDSRKESNINVTQQNTNFKPVIRGIKVGELAKLYEERAQGLELLRSL